MKKETVTVISYGERDRFGNPPAELGRAQYPGCILWPRTGSEDTERGFVVHEGLNLAFPNDRVSINSQSRVAARGEEWEVDGPPAVYLGKRTLVVLKKVGTDG